MFNEILEFTEEEAQRMHYALRRHADTCRKKYKQGFRLIHNPGKKPNKYVPIERWGLAFDHPIEYIKTEYDDEQIALQKFEVAKFEK